MGTSGSFDGPGGGTPLVPTWLEDPEGGAPPLEQSQTPLDSTPGDSSPPPAPPERPFPPLAGPPNRFTGARRGLARFARSGGKEHNTLRSSVSHYVSTASGGARQAARRMGSSRAAGGRLLSFLTDVQSRGAQAALRALNLEALAGRPVEEIFLGLVDIIVPNSATVDEGIARNAFVETIVDLAEAGITNLDGLTADQVQTVFEIFVAHAIEGRLCNDIGAKLVALPADLRSAERVQAQLNDYIRGAVKDALVALRTDLATLTADRVAVVVTGIYEGTFRILQVLGEPEAS